MSNKKIVVIVCVALFVLGLACGIMCAYECDVCKYYADLSKLLLDEPGRNQNFEGFMLMLFSSIFCFLIVLLCSFLLLYSLKKYSDVNIDEIKLRKITKQEQDKQKKIDKLQAQIDALKNN